jgi:tRNA threonylcarbamoyl adenosine modification protein YeaZ
LPPKPLSLGFDTSAAHGAAALLLGDTVLSEVFEPLKKGQAERLLPLLETVLGDHGYGWSDVSAIGVGIGPGNFTGIRIGVSAARGLALSLGIPAIGVSRFIAQAVDAPRPVLSCIDARRDIAYVQDLPDGDHRLMQWADIPTDLPVIGGPEQPELDTVIARGVATEAARVFATTTTAIARPAPLYIRAADAAPPRDPAPKIIT